MGRERDDDLYEGIGKFFEKAGQTQIFRLGVREDGPDAWGACFSIPDGSLVRWNDGAWEYVEKGGTQWLTSSGTEVDVVCCDEEGRLSCKRYISEDL